MQADPRDVVDVPDPGAVIRFLTANPEFFKQNEDILPRLRIPHVSGSAVSLIEHQVSVLRGKCTSLENSLRDLIGVARDNEALQHRLHQLVQEIISAPLLDDVVAATRRALCSHFGADEVHVLLIDDRSQADQIGRSGAGVADADDRHGEGCYRTMNRNDPRLGHFGALFEGRGTHCGLPDAAQQAVLIGDDACDPGSAATIPLQYQGSLGLVMLASRDEARFGAGKGVVFLDQLGDVLSRRVHALARDMS